ncbi:hypothetical protein BGX28_000980 [Mortierella sp. GBA30]|nr:hypothetical protein BGX28_000980 [Mortierella sp. GBA30]
MLPSPRSNTNPLDLPEIITRIGWFIPLWIKRPTSSDLLLQPRDLISCLSVNSAFYAILTPILWTVYNDRAFRHPYSVVDGEQGRHSAPNPDVLLKNSIHFRFFETRITDITLRYRCTQLQELTLTRRIREDLAVELILANPDLRHLNWECQIDVPCPMRTQEYAALGRLQKLVSLELAGWTFEHHLLSPILRRNQLRLQNLSFIFCGGLDSIQEWVQLPRLTTLTLDYWYANAALPELIRYCPALETLTIQPDSECNAEAIGRYLHEHCPRLSALQCMDVYRVFSTGIMMEDEQYLYLLEGCPLAKANTVMPASSVLTAEITLTSINMATTSPLPTAAVNTTAMFTGLRHFEMSIGDLIDSFTAVLLNHAPSLEILELYICGDDRINFENANRLLKGCLKLKRFSMFNYLLEWSPQDGMLLFRDPWGCNGLEELTLDGFASVFEEDQMIHEHERGGDEPEDNREDMNEAEELVTGYTFEQAQDAQDDTLGRNTGKTLEKQQLDQQEDNDGGTQKQDLWNAADLLRMIQECKEEEGVVMFSERDIIPDRWEIRRSDRYRDILESSQGHAFKRRLFLAADAIPNLKKIVLNATSYHGIK